MSRIDDIAAAIFRYLRAHPEEGISISTPFAATDESWGDIDGAAVDEREYHMACQQLLRQKKAVPSHVHTPSNSEGNLPTSSKALRRMGGYVVHSMLAAIKLNPQPVRQKNKARPQPKRYLPAFDPEAAPRQPRPPKTKAQVKTAAKLEPQEPISTPPPPRIDIEQDLLLYAQQALATLRRHAKPGRPWQVIGKQDCSKLVRTDITGLSRAAASRLIDILRVCEFFRVTPSGQNQISHVLAEGELNAHTLRGKGFVLQESPDELRAELGTAHERLVILSNELRNEQQATSELRQTLQDIQEEVSTANTTIAALKQEVATLNDLLEQAAPDQPSADQMLNKALRSKALAIIKRWQ